jgi:hypothetical protein
MIKLLISNEAIEKLDKITNGSKTKIVEAMDLLRNGNLSGVDEIAGTKPLLYYKLIGNYAIILVQESAGVMILVDVINKDNLIRKE